MAGVGDIARRFSLAGVLDDDARARERYPISEIEVADIADHPGNAAYSMDEGSICSLADSISRDGLTDIPLVRRLDDGSFQMISGHRRKAAYELLAREDPSFSRMPCRVVEGIGDEQAVTLLHTANYFTRELTVMERARATQALGIEVRRMREADPSLKGVRSSSLKAAIIKAQTGRDVAPRTIEHHERIARVVEERLEPEWRERAERGELSDADIQRLAKMGRAAQSELAASAPAGGGASGAIKEAARASEKAPKKRGKRRSGPTAQSLRSDPSELVSRAAGLVREARSALERGARLDPAALAELEGEVSAARDAARRAPAGGA